MSILRVALGKVRPSSIERKAVAPGEYNGDVLVRLLYDLKVGEDFEKPVNVPWQKLACIAFSKLNEATQDAIIREAADGGENIKELVKDVSPSVKAKVRSLMPERECNGLVTGDVFVELVKEVRTEAINLRKLA